MTIIQNLKSRLANPMGLNRNHVAEENNIPRVNHVLYIFYAMGVQRVASIQCNRSFHEIDVHRIHFVKVTFFFTIFIDNFSTIS